MHPVSQLCDAGGSFRPDYDWGGSHAIEVAVDDEGNDAIDEDPVDIIDDDGLLNEDPADGPDKDGDGLVDEDASAAAIPLSRSIRRVVYEYDPEAADSGLIFHWGDRAFEAHGTDGERGWQGRFRGCWCRATG